MPDYLLELRSEEIPAAMQRVGAEALHRGLTSAFAEAGVEPVESEIRVTPRRLVWIGRGMPSGTSAVRETRRGPRTSAPERAVEGFLRSAGIEREALVTEGEGSAARYLAILEVPGKSLDSHIAERVPAVLRSVRWPKSMRWGRGSFRWVRPLRSIVSVIEEGGQVRPAPFDLEGIPVGCETRGHPFLADTPLRVTAIGDYAAQLGSAFVQLSSEDRRARIEEGARRMAKENGLELVDDPGLLDELAGLVEWPVLHFGRIEPDFRHLPGEVLRAAMRTHQRYLSLRDPMGGGIAGYVAVADTDPEDGGARIRAGYARVLRARLSDAAFFWANDRARGLEGMQTGLQGMVYHAQLGGVAERVERIGFLAERIARQIGADADQVRRAALLAKCDLASETVGEFPALQGTAGARLAALAGEDAAVVDAIAGQYRPAGPSDDTVSGPVAASLAVADRADALYGFFAAGLRPTGSKDPFALRRSALALLRTLEENTLRLPLAQLMDWASEAHAGVDLPNRHDAVREVLDFVLERLSVSLRERGFRHDVIAAVRGTRDDSDAVSLGLRVQALSSFLAKSVEAGHLLSAYTRVRSILDDEGVPVGIAPPRVALFREPEESSLQSALAEVEQAVEAALRQELDDVAMAGLAGLRGPVDAFFDRVTVNVEGEELRDNRLRLLARARRTMERVAAFGELEGR